MRRLLYPFDWTLSLLASVLRLGAGGRAPRPDSHAQPIILYEFENCPFCRIAREAISATGIVVDVRPCPKQGTRYRPRAVELGGKAQFPYVSDPNTGTSMYESADISAYVRKTYAPGRRPLIHWLAPLSLFSSIAVVFLRQARGMIAATANSPDLPLSFSAPENSPGARIVRETLSTREIRYYWTSSPKDSGPPLLQDENTGEQVRGSLAILTYLDRTYPTAAKA